MRYLKSAIRRLMASGRFQGLDFLVGSSFDGPKHPLRSGRYEEDDIT